MRCSAMSGCRRVMQQSLLCKRLLMSQRQEWVSMLYLYTAP